MFCGLSAAFLVILIFSSIGLLLAFAFGKVAFFLPVAEGKLLSVVGAFLAGWATLFELGGFVETFDGQALHEVIRPILFRVLFLSGVVLATLGQLW